MTSPEVPVPGTAALAGVPLHDASVDGIRYFPDTQVLELVLVLDGDAGPAGKLRLEGARDVQSKPLLETLPWSETFDGVVLNVTVGDAAADATKVRFAIQLHDYEQRQNGMLVLDATFQTARWLPTAR